jgi:uncharacterized protein (DUF2267 family)
MSRCSSSAIHAPTHPISRAALLERLADSRIPDREVAEKALRATLAVLSQRLMDDEAGALAACLPADLARVVGQSDYYDYDADFGDAEFYDRVRRRERTTPSGVHEHVDVVVRSLGELLDPDVRRRLARALPERIASRLRASAFGSGE